MEKQYSWVLTHQAIAEKLPAYRNRQNELIEILKSAGVSINQDEEEGNIKIPLEEIDPFTFFGHIYKHGPTKRLEILQEISIKFDAPYPEGEAGIPSTHGQKTWLFPFKRSRKNNEIERLWDFFELCLKDELNDDLFKDLLNINGVGKIKLTESLFSVNPDKYFPLNGSSINFINEEIGVNPEFSTYSEYLKVLSEIKEKTDVPFYELSHQAYEWTNKSHPSTSADKEKFKKVLERLDLTEVENFFQIMDLLVEQNNLEPDDNRIVFSLRDKNLNFIVGQRYCLNLFGVYYKGKYGVISERRINESSHRFNEKYPLPLYSYVNEPSPIFENIQDISTTIQKELDSSVKSGFSKHNNLAFEKAVFDLDYRKELIGDLHKKPTTMEKDTDQPLNQIFFGPPGTGKTFNSVNRAIEITDPEFYRQNKDNRHRLRQRFKELLITDWEEPKGQIAFCTFHQSFSYEDFVEGIKPKVNEERNVIYSVEDGIFKRICDLANSSKSSTKLKREGKVAWNSNDYKSRRAHFFKLSLGEANNPEDREIYDFCVKNSYIAIGFGGDVDYTGKTETEIKESCSEENNNPSAGSQLSTFIHGLRKDSYVIISKGNQYVRALGRVIGDYEYHDEFPIRYNHFRKVEWIFTDENIPVEELYETTLMQRTIYKIDEDKLKRDFFVYDGSEAFSPEVNIKPYILIIDEINRGNISSIFGELITLIEKDKRSGGSEELELTLPYSKETFKVPDNVYLLGTMNTADRSIEALDTALRRRFSFREFPPQPDLIASEASSGKKGGVINGIDLKELLKAINKRIEKLIDKDHRIGHSYFLKVDSMPKLKAAFKDEIIPLLEEYFFGDYGKIGLVLGSSFIEKETNNFEFASFEGYEPDVRDDLKEKAVFTICKEEKWDFKSLY